jgi:hypothetical protein
MEELKELVRKWNLHQERNFWRHNTTKDGKSLSSSLFKETL